MAQNVALIGLGTMGAGMAKNLRKAGFALTVYNRTRSKAEALAESGLVIADTPAQAAEHADVILSMVADDAVSRDVWTGSDGALRTARKGAIAIESSTVTPAWIAELAKEASAKGVVLLDAPVTGSRIQAETGVLNFMVGGDPASLEAVRPVLEAMGKNIYHLGPTGSGARMKLINNYMCAVQVASLAEAITWIERSGLDAKAAIERLKQGAPGSPLVAGISDRMLPATYEFNFSLELMEKDIRYAAADASSHGTELRMAEAARTRFDDALGAGLGEKDMSAVIAPLRGK